MKGKSEIEQKKLRDANQYLKQWLFEHIDNPYPTADEKKTLMMCTNLSRKRIDAWFKNARHRYMCSASKVVNPNYSRYPSQVTKILVDWLVQFSSEAHRYPNHEEEEKLLKQTKLTKVQLRRWFSNARKRGLLERIKKNRYSPDEAPAPNTTVQAQQGYSQEQNAAMPYQEMMPKPSYNIQAPMLHAQIPPQNLVYLNLPTVNASLYPPQSTVPIPVPQYPNVYQGSMMSQGLPMNLYKNIYC